MKQRRAEASQTSCLLDGRVGHRIEIGERRPEGPRQFPARFRRPVLLQEAGVDQAGEKVPHLTLRCVDLVGQQHVALLEPLVQHAGKAGRYHPPRLVPGNQRLGGARRPLSADATFDQDQPTAVEKALGMSEEKFVREVRAWAS